MSDVRLCIIRGCPGSGKSTFAKKLAAKYGLLHFENDAYLMQGDKYVWTPAAAKYAARQCFNDCMNALKSGKSCVVSNVFVTRRVVDKYANAAKAIGVRVGVFRMTKDFGNVHNVPKSTLDSMKAGFEDYPNEVIV